MAQSFTDLRVWQQAMDLIEHIYRDTEEFPKPELYGLVSQVRRAAVSVASNIAEGKGAGTDREYCRFLFHARGSLMEVQTQIMIAARLNYLSEGAANQLLRRCEQVGRSLAGLINSMSEEHSSEAPTQVTTRPTAKSQRPMAD